MIIINILLVLFILITIILIIDQNNKDNKNIDQKILKFSKLSTSSQLESVPTISGGSVECNYRGLLVNGICDCDSSNSVGNSCQYNDKTTCNGRGQADDNGKCRCDITFKGPNCQYSNYDTCSNRGVVDEYGFCSCSWGFTGNSCEQDPVIVSPGTTLSPPCPEGFSGPNCQLNANAQYCNSNGIFKITRDSNTGGERYTCDCSMDQISRKKWKGSDCRFLDRIDCNGYGQVDNRGYCTCDNPEVRGGPACLSCPNGKAGSVKENCVYSDVVTCYGKGKAQNDGSCKCNDGYNGNRCQYGNIENCSGKGIVGMDGKCTCLRGDWGKAMGQNCEFTDFYNCNGNGDITTRAPTNSDPTPIPYCKCFPLFNGASCNTCKDQFVGNYCNYFKDNARFVNADGSLIVNFSSPGLIVIAKKKSPTSTSTPTPTLSLAFNLEKENYDIFYSGYYINKDGRLTTELFFANENNSVSSINNLVFDLFLINNQGENDISSINLIESIDVIFSSKNEPTPYRLIRCTKY